VALDESGKLYGDIYRPAFPSMGVWPDLSLISRYSVPTSRWPARSQLRCDP